MGKKILVFLFLVCLFSVRPVFAGTEFWSVDTFQFPVKEKVKFNIIPELRFRNNASEFYYLLTYIGPTISLSKSFDINLYLAPKYSKNGGNWTTSTVGFFDVIYKNDLLSNRGRFEYDFPSGVLKIRDQLQFKRNGWFVNDEVFYNYNKSYIDENRAATGYAFKVLSNFDLSLGYLLRSQKSSASADWVNTNVFTLNTSLKI